jgi:hypothetical protein
MVRAQAVPSFVLAPVSADLLPHEPAAAVAPLAFANGGDGAEHNFLSCPRS